MWCDGFLPSIEALPPGTDTIVGHAFVCFGSVEERWTFALRLPDRVHSRDQVPWAILLPPDDVTAWLTIDVEARHLVVAPQDAMADAVARDAATSRLPPTGERT